MLALQFTLLTALLGAESITLGFTGDIMVHNSQLRRAWLGEDAGGRDRGYDFGPSFEWFSEHLAASDLTVGNFETTLGGPDSAWITDDQWAFREYQAYPTFTSPDELAAALADAGFDLLGTANNHCMDSNLEGVARTLEVLEAAGLRTTGTARSGSPVPWRGRVGTFDLSVLAWTASVNGLISSRGMDGVNVFNARGRDGRLEEMLADIRDEAARDPDLVILCIHWGQEYLTEPDQYQKNLAALAIDAGADIIIGSHPHVLQPVETRVVDRDGDGPEAPREAFIAWSMGNFISSQRHIPERREWVDGSVMLNLEIRRDAHGRARVAGLTFIPFYVHWTDAAIRVLALGDGLADGAADLYGLSDQDRSRLEALDAWIPAQMTRYLAERPARRIGDGWRVEF